MENLAKPTEQIRADIHMLIYSHLTVLVCCQAGKALGFCVC